MPDSEQRQNDALIEFTDVSAEYGQAIVDILLKPDVLEHIPVVKSALAGMRIFQTVRDNILLRKLEIFCTALSSIPAVERIQMIEDLNCDPNFSHNIGEHLIELLDRIDGRRKPAMVAAAFAAYANHQIDRRMLFRINVAIERVPAIDINVVRRLGLNPFQPADTIRDDEPNIEYVSLQALNSAGLLATESGYGGLVYRVNETGAMFVNLNLDRTT